MELDLSADVLIETIILGYGKDADGNERPKDTLKDLDIVDASDELRRMYAKGETDKLGDDGMAAVLREYLVKLGAVNIPAAKWAPHAVAQTLMAKAEDLKKKFEAKLWGIGAVRQEWPAITADLPHLGP